MTWTSDYGAQWAGLKGLRASGLKGLEPIHYSTLFTTKTMSLAMRWAAQKISVSHRNLPTLSKFKVWGRGEQKKTLRQYVMKIILIILYFNICTMHLLLQHNNIFIIY